MITEEDIKNIKEDLAVIRDTQAKGVYVSYRIDQAIEYIEQLESKVKELEKADWEVLCEECSSAAKEAGLTKEDTRRILEEYRTIERKAMEYDTLIKERDFYKEKYLECNDIEGDIKLNTEAMLKDLGKRYEVYRDNTCLHCGNGKPAYCERLLSRTYSKRSKSTKEVI